MLGLKMKDSRDVKHQRSRVPRDGGTQLLMHLGKQTQKGHLPSDATSSTGVPLLVNFYTLFWS